MRTILALAFIALLAGAFAHKSKAPIQESKLVASLKGLFQLAAKDELDEVAEILATVREEIENTLNGVKSNYAQEEADWEDVLASYDEAHHDITTGLDQLATDIANAEEVADELQEAIDSAVSAIADAQAQQDTEEARRTDYHNSFKENVGKLNSAVENAEDALRLLQEIDTQDLSGSFLEINHKKIKSNFEAIHKTLKGMKANTSLSPLTKMLVEVAAEGINHDLIAQLEDLLQQLVDALHAEVDAAVAADNNDDEYSRATLANLQSTIDTLTSSAEGNQAQHDELVAEIEEAHAAEEWLAGVWEELSHQRDEAQAAWDEKSSNYDALIKRLRRDIEAIDAAVNFVDRDDE